MRQRTTCCRYAPIVGPQFKNDHFRPRRLAWNYGGGGGVVYLASLEADPADEERRRMGARAATSRSARPREVFFIDVPPTLPSNKLRSHATSSHLAVTLATGTNLTWSILSGRPACRPFDLPGVDATSDRIYESIYQSYHRSFAKTGRATTRSLCGTCSTRSLGRVAHGAERISWSTGRCEDLILIDTLEYRKHCRPARCETISL